MSSAGNPIISGIDPSYIDPSFRPQDDLYRYFNGAWLANHEIPQDRSSDGITYQLYLEAEAQVRDIIETATGGGDAQKIRDLYDCFLDTAAISKAGITPLQDDLAAIDRITNRAEFIKTLADLEMRGLGGAFGLGIYGDAMNSQMNIVYLGQGGLSLPDEAYYREEQYEEIRQAFKVHVAKMFALAGITDGASLAEQIYELERQIASHHFDQVKDRDVELTYNKMTFAELSKLAPNFDWASWLEFSQIPKSAFAELVVQQPPFFAGLSEILENFNPAPWQAWMKWQLISGAAAYLTDDFVNQNFDFYAKTLSGTPEIRVRWKRAISFVEGALGEAIGRIYVERHFPEAAKVAMLELVDNLIEAYRISINELPWMSPETKAKAQDKLAKFTPKIGYPDKWRDYSALTITGDDLFGNIGRITKFSRDIELAKIGKPVDKSEWLMTPQTVNAYYHPIQNEIVFPAAILQPPFFNLESDIAANYGGIGAVIGHEIGHGFDDQGSKFDGDGNMIDWWTAADRVEFDKRANELIKQFDALYPQETPDIHVNGALTVGENIGDLGGLAIGFKAYKLALKGQPAPVLDGLTGEQRFFLSWAQAWRGKVRAEELRRRIATDPHSPYEFRCNAIVRNISEFYTAFDLTEGDKLWLAEKDRVEIW
ncbi:MAG: M13-type metalloendopeptidase [Candidatus Planktophila sp.]